MHLRSVLITTGIALAVPAPTPPRSPPHARERLCVDVRPCPPHPLVDAFHPLHRYFIPTNTSIYRYYWYLYL